MSEEKYKKTDRYLDKEMSREEKDAFEMSLKTDKELQRKLEIQKEIREALSEEDIMQLRERMAEAMQQPVKKKIAWYKIAVVLIPLLLGGGWLMNHFTSRTTEDLFQEYYLPYEPISNSRSSYNYAFENREIRAAIDAYSQKKYSVAAKNFASIDATKIDIPDIQLQMACSFLLSNREVQAIEIFKDIAKSNHPLFAQKAEWYLALAYLKKDQIKNAKEVLTKISTSNHYKSREAIEIMEKLE